MWSSSDDASSTEIPQGDAEAKDTATPVTAISVPPPPLTSMQGRNAGESSSVGHGGISADDPHASKIASPSDVSSPSFTKRVTASSARHRASSPSISSQPSPLLQHRSPLNKSEAQIQANPNPNPNPGQRSASEDGASVDRTSGRKRRRYAFNFARSSSSSSSSSTHGSKSRSGLKLKDCDEVDQLLSSVKRRRVDEEDTSHLSKAQAVASSEVSKRWAKDAASNAPFPELSSEGEDSLDERPHLDHPQFLSKKVEFALDRGVCGETPEGLRSTDDVSKLAKKISEFRKNRQMNRCRLPSLLTLAIQRLEGTSRRLQARVPPGLWEVVEEVRSNVRGRIVLNACINQYLTDYQREGVQFMFDAFQYGVGRWRGGVLADEMGLGKTVQVLAFLCAIQRKTGRPSDEALLNRSRDDDFPVALVVCPASVLDNWQEEARRWGYFAVEVARTNEKMEQVLEMLHRRKLDMVIMSYAKLRHFNQMDEFKSYTWAVAIFDEVHLCKNRSSQTTLAAKALKAGRKFGLTGTPVQNNLDEFWSIMDVISPGLFLSDNDFRARFTAPIRTGMRKGASAREIKAKRNALEELSRWQELLVLRREKSVIKAKLRFGKKDLIVLCPLSPLQEEAYLRFLSSQEVLFLKATVQGDEPAVTLHHLPLWRLQHRSDGILPGDHQLPPQSRPAVDLSEGEEEEEEAESEDSEGGLAESEGMKVVSTDVHSSSEEDEDLAGCGQGMVGEEGSVKGKRERRKRTFMECRGCPFCLYLPCITILRKIANHLEMIRVDKSLPHGFERYKRLRTARIVLGKDGEIFRSRSFHRLSNENHCGKLLVLKTLLRKWKRAKHKVLFFSNSTVLLDIVESFILKLNLRSLRLDGDTPQQERQALCKEFNEDKHVFLMLVSTKAGGVGLNLTGAQKVVIFDPSWNPSDDLQAQDRAYRIGQTQRVEVYRLVSKGTIEEAALIGQVDKQQLASMVLDDSNFQKRLFNADEVRGMKMKLSYFTQGLAAKLKQEKRGAGRKFRVVGGSSSEEGKMANQAGKFDILDENMRIFETCGIEDTLDWNDIVTHDEESKAAELAAIQSAEDSEQMIARYGFRSDGDPSEEEP